jgi:hypothetical protein
LTATVASTANAGSQVGAGRGGGNAVIVPPTGSAATTR